MVTNYRTIGAISGIRSTATISQMRSRMGSPQIDSEFRIIGAIAERIHGSQVIEDRMAAGPLLILLKGIGPLIKLEQGRIADEGQEETAAGGRRRRRRSSSSAAPKAPLPRGSPRSRSAGGPKGEGMMGSPCLPSSSLRGGEMMGSP